MDFPLPHIFDFIPFLVENALWILLGVGILAVIYVLDWAYRKAKQKFPWRVARKE